MRTLFQTLLLVAWLAIPSLLFAMNGDAILGEWVTEGGDCRVEIFKRDQRYFGKILAIKPPNYLPGELDGMDGEPRQDSENKDESMRSRPLVGIELLQDLLFDDGKWVGGSIYDPKNGTTYSCEISLAEDGTMRLRGYVGVSLLGRTTVWESARVYRERELAFLGLCDCSRK